MPTQQIANCLRCDVQFRKSKKGPWPKWCPECRQQRAIERSRAKYKGPDPRPCMDCELVIYPPRKGGHSKIRCNPCAKQAQRKQISEWYKRHPEKQADMWRRHKQRRRAAKHGALIERFSFKEICIRDGWKCGICDHKIDPSCKYPDPRSPSLDHIHPLSKGGPHTRANVQLACLDCNHEKSDSLPQAA